MAGNPGAMEPGAAKSKPSRQTDLHLIACQASFEWLQLMYPLTCTPFLGPRIAGKFQSFELAPNVGPVWAEKIPLH